MDLQSIRNDVLARLGPAHELTSPQLSVFINEGYNIVKSKVIDSFEDYYGTSETISIVAGTQEYTPTTNFLSIRKVEMMIDGAWVRISPTELRDIPTQTTTTIGGRPHYYLWGNNIGIVSTPTEDTTLKIYGIAPPVDLSGNTDIPDFPSTHHWLLTQWGYACALEAAGENFSAAREKRNQFYDGLDDLINLIKDRNADELHSVKLEFDDHL